MSVLLEDVDENGIEPYELVPSDTDACARTLDLSSWTSYAAHQSVKTAVLERISTSGVHVRPSMMEDFEDIFGAFGVKSLHRRQHILWNMVVVYLNRFRRPVLKEYRHHRSNKTQIVDPILQMEIEAVFQGSDFFLSELIFEDTLFLEVLEKAKEGDLRWVDFYFWKVWDFIKLLAKPTN